MHPVLFLIFNRPDTTARVFEAIRAARPPRLYVAADGPRANRPGEAELCEEARRIATTVDWPCDVKVLFRDQNLGCGRAVFEAISWFFQYEPEGIILEDDLLPDATFFTYCTELLARYRDDARVMAIGGSGYGDADRFGTASYTFARIFDPWGWASWRRAWSLHDAGVLGGLHDSGQLLDRAGPSGFECGEMWRGQFGLAAAGRIDTWDYPWMFSIFKAGGLVAYPATNLISNLGFRADATHTRHAENEEKPSNAERPLVSLVLPVSHPPRVRNNVRYEIDYYSRRLELSRLPRQVVVWRAVRHNSSIVMAKVAPRLWDRLKALRDRCVGIERA